MAATTVSPRPLREGQAVATGHWSARRRERPITCLGDVSEVSDGGRSAFAKLLPRDYPWRKIVRKWWEWDYLAGCAEALGALRPDATALGIGVGVEPLMYYFAARFGRVVATDIYSDDSSWPDSNLAKKRMYAESPIPYPQDRLEFRSADMRDTRQPDDSVDLVWSTSTIEHVGSLREVIRTYREIHRILKPGGHAVLTTEFCLTEPPFLLENVCAHDPVLFDAVVRRLGGLEVVGVVDLSYNWTHPGNAGGSLRYHNPDWAFTGARGQLFDSGTGSGRPFARFPSGACARSGAFGSVAPYFRCGQMAIHFGLSVIAPIGLVLKKVGRSVRAWEEYELPEDWRRFVDAQHLMFTENRFADALAILRDLIAGFGAVTPPQFRMHALCLYARALIAVGGPCDDRNLRPIRAALEELPDYGVVDGVALDPCATALSFQGDFQASADLYWACMVSPSTNKVLAVRLGLPYVHSMKRLGKFRAAVDNYAVMIRDLLANGVPPAEVVNQVEDSLEWVSGINYFDADELRAVRQAVADEVTAWGGEYAAMCSRVAGAVGQKASKAA